MNLNNPITTMIFDFGGVIIDLDLKRCVENFKNLGVNNVEQYLGNFGQKDFFLQFEKGEITVDEFRNSIRNLTAVSLTDEDIDNAWGSFLVEVPDERIHLLSELRNKYRLLLLSNTNQLHIENDTKKEFGRRGKDIYEFFDKCYLSYKMHLAKPDPAIFQTLLIDAGVKPEECLFLDDSPKNIATAQQLGINSHLVKAGEDLSFLLNI